MLQETGHLNPTFKLARSLKSRGHRVVYSTTPDMAAHIAAQGFDHLSWYPELFPQDLGRARATQGLLARRRSITAQFQALTKAVSQGFGAAGQLAENKPDLVLADVNQPHLAFLARKLRIPLLLVNTSLPQTKARAIAPLRSALGFDPSLKGQLQAELAWQRFLTSRRVSAKLAGWFGMCPPYAMAQQIAPQFGITPGELDARTVYMPQLRGVPELVLCPECFDFPRETSPNRHYVESLDLARKSETFDWTAIPHAKPLIYCALGGQLYRPRETPDFFRRIVRVFAEKPEWHLLLALGRHISAEQLGTVPSNVTVATSVPQLAVLERAQLMITHGGLGSVKECIFYGVPMVVMPLSIDQPGNAARVVYHGLGRAGDVGKSREQDLRELVAGVLGDDSVRRNLQHMQARFKQVEDANYGAEIVEKLLAQP